MTPSNQAAEVERTTLDNNCEWLTGLTEVIHTNGTISPDASGRVYAIRDQLRTAVNAHSALVAALAHMQWCSSCAQGNWEDCEDGRKALALLAAKGA